MVAGKIKMTRFISYQQQLSFSSIKWLLEKKSLNYRGRTAELETKN
jgi:hypothetical protein